MYKAPTFIMNKYEKAHWKKQYRDRLCKSYKNEHYLLGLGLSIIRQWFIRRNNKEPETLYDFLVCENPATCYIPKTLQKRMNEFRNRKFSWYERPTV